MFVLDYTRRQALRKLGYTVDLSELSLIEVEINCLIANEFNKLESEEIKKASKKKR